MMAGNVFLVYQRFHCVFGVFVYGGILIRDF